VTNEDHNSRVSAAVIPACKKKFKNSHSPATTARERVRDEALRDFLTDNAADCGTILDQRKLGSFNSKANHYECCGGAGN